MSGSRHFLHQNKMIDCAVKLTFYRYRDADGNDIDKAILCAVIKGIRNISTVTELVGYSQWNIDINIFRSILISIFHWHRSIVVFIDINRRHKWSYSLHYCSMVVVESSVDTKRLQKPLRNWCLFGIDWWIGGRLGKGRARRLTPPISSSPFLQPPDRACRRWKGYAETFYEFCLISPVRAHDNNRFLSIDIDCLAFAFEFHYCFA